MDLMLSNQRFITPYNTLHIGCAPRQRRSLRIVLARSQRDLDDGAIGNGQ
jgi:hypothetical protein